MLYNPTARIFSGTKQRELKNILSFSSQEKVGKGRKQTATSKFSIQLKNKWKYDERGKPQASYMCGVNCRQNQALFCHISEVLDLADVKKKKFCLRIGLCSGQLLGGLPCDRGPSQDGRHWCPAVREGQPLAVRLLLGLPVCRFLKTAQKSKLLFPL